MLLQFVSNKDGKQTPQAINMLEYTQNRHNLYYDIFSQCGHIGVEKTVRLELSHWTL